MRTLSSKGLISSNASLLMSLGYPISSENPDLESNLWRYWMSSFAEFQVQFDGNGRVREITTDANTRNLVWVP